MKRTIAAFAFFAATTIALATRALAQEQPFQVNVPFNFSVGDRQFPVGNYHVKMLGIGQVQIENLNHDIFTSALAFPANRSSDENYKLVFDNVGGQYFLREVLSTSKGMELPKSELEKKAQLQMQTLLKQSLDAEAGPHTAQGH